MKLPLPQILVAGSLALAGGAGFFAANAGGQAAPTRTVTLDIPTGTGEQGPPGPPGPKGDPGESGVACLDGFSPGILVINHPGGHVRIYTCLAD